MAATTVVGIHLERTGGTVISGTRHDSDDNDDLRLTPKSLDTFSWPQNSPEKAKRKVLELANFAAQLGSDPLHAMGVAGPGPFVSLRRVDSDFGAIHGERSHPPLRGLNLYTIFEGALRKQGKSPKANIIIHTDAVACAIGEAIARKTDKRIMLAFIIIGDGIGLGVVRGRSPIRSALHPEIGLLEVRVHRDEGARFPIKEYPKKLAEVSKDTVLEPTSYSVAQLASNIAIRERCKKIDVTADKALGTLQRDSDREYILDRRAYYLAQMCLACTVMLAPHQIVLGEAEKFASEPDLAGRVSQHFRAFLDARKTAGQPLFEYPELIDPSFISNSWVMKGVAPRQSLGVTGAMGMMYAALVSDVGDKTRPELD